MSAQNGLRIKAFATQLKHEECLNFRNRSKSGPGKVTEGAELPDTKEVEVDDLIDEYIDLIKAEDINAKRLWILVAKGRSWSIDLESETNEVAPEECVPISMRLAIRPA